MTSPHQLPGSHRVALSHCMTIGAPSPDDVIEITLVLRRKNPLPDRPGRLDKETFAATYGADPADVQAVTEALKAAGAAVLSTDLASRRLRVAGPVGVLSALFGTHLSLVRDATPGAAGMFRARTGGLTLPAALHERVTAVLGLDDRPQARAHFRAVPAARTGLSYTPVELGRIYNFPPGTDGTGRTIAIIELGGGFAQSDLDTYFSGLGLETPAVRAVGVDGGRNVAGRDPNGADGEVLLDIEVAGALAPKAEIVVYFAPNTDAGFLDAVATAAHADPTPDAISISWGAPESQWTAQARGAFDEALADASALGVTVTAAAGDNGSSDGLSDRKSHVDFPAASPHALACGGTRLVADGATGEVSSETVWNNGLGGGATGGGVSTGFPQPDWQVPATEPVDGRGVPDVAGNADPQTGYRVLVDGTPMVIGGTSAVSPLWAALIARMNQATGQPLGLAQPPLYDQVVAAVPAPGFRDIVTGNNGAYQAGPGWDACTGLGVPDGATLLLKLAGPPAPPPDGDDVPPDGAAMPPDGTDVPPDKVT